jgi:molybdopterin synthase sulfur carrier subunit
MRLVYFSWVRERIGKGDEEVDLPENIVTVRDLLDWLKTRGEEYEAALEHADTIRVALDMEHVHHSEKIGTPFEIALFPPMTGG